MRFSSLVILIVLSFQTFAFDRLYINREKGLFLRETDDAIDVFDTKGMTKVYYHHAYGGNPDYFQRWHSYEGYPDSIHVDKIIDYFGFERLKPELPKSWFKYELAVTDSVEEERMPCGQADYPDLGMNFHYDIKIRHADRILHEASRSRFSFHFSFNRNKALAGLIRSTSIWQDPIANCFYMQTGEGFIIISD